MIYCNGVCAVSRRKLFIDYRCLSTLPITGIRVCTVEQNRCKGDSPCQWKTPIFRPSVCLRDRKPLNRSTSNLIWVTTSGTSPHIQTLVFIPLKGARVDIREVVIILVYFYLPPYFFTFLRTCTGQ